jgi:hypothetical protein
MPIAAGKKESSRQPKFAIPAQNCLSCGGREAALPGARQIAGFPGRAGGLVRLLPQSWSPGQRSAPKVHAEAASLLLTSTFSITYAVSRQLWVLWSRGRR